MILHSLKNHLSKGVFLKSTFWQCHKLLLWQIFKWEVSYSCFLTMNIGLGLCSGLIFWLGKDVNISKNQGHLRSQWFRDIFWANTYNRFKGWSQIWNSLHNRGRRVKEGVPSCFVEWGTPPILPPPPLPQRQRIVWNDFDYVQYVK